MEGQMEVQEIFAILHKWGIHTLGQLARLDKEQLGARLGPEAIRMWERANGQSNRGLKRGRPLSVAVHVSAHRASRKRIDQMHFAWSHFRGVPITPHSRLLPHMGRRDRLSLSPAGRDGREAPVRAKEWVWERAG